ncbi:unnamed protein product [Phytomonas sp. Hart1]|nr:unnamed protein product [Phytomonas sp. Hart1]|eukprot:CCW70288.1 unnamed protein product [Phytomonas sp. isolate Hart1]
MPQENSKSLLKRDSLSEAEKWRIIIDNTLKFLSIGLLCGGTFSVVTFRSLTARAAITAFGAGFGLGKSYVDTKFILGHDVPAEAMWAAQVVPLKSDRTSIE